MEVEEAEKKNEKNTTCYLHIFVGQDITCSYEVLCSITCVGVNVLEL